MKGSRNEKCVGEKKNGMDKERKEDIPTDRQMDRKIEDNATVKKAKRAG